MGELIVTEFVTLDGVAQAPGEPDEDRDGGWSRAFRDLAPSFEGWLAAWANEPTPAEREAARQAEARREPP